MIESVKNERIKEFSKLNSKKYREQTNLFLIEGKHLVKEAQKKKLVQEIFLLQGEDNEYGEVTYVTDQILKKLSNLTTAPKIIAVCHKPKNEGIQGNIIILENISDPGNLGTIIRSSVAFDYQTIILSPNTVDFYNPKVIRATEGMLFHSNIIIRDLKPLIKVLIEEGYQILGTDVISGKTPEKQDKKHALIIGNEVGGISNEIKELCHQNLYIRMNPKCESLNAGVAASILMYELNK